MPDFSLLTRSACATLQKVLGMDVSILSTQEEYEVSAAALGFYGAYNGTLTLLLAADSVRLTADMLLKIFHIETPVEDSLVFAEFLNIFAGNLATELKRRGVTMNIHAPGATQSYEPPDSNPQALTLRCADGPVFTFCFYLKEISQ